MRASEPASEPVDFNLNPTKLWHQQPSQAVAETLTFLLALTFAGSALGLVCPVQEVIVQAQLTIVLLLKLFLSLQELALEKQTILLEAKEEVLHPAHPSVIDNLTDCLTH
mgnify:CR=1 FL=1